MQLHTCSRGSRPRRATTTPTSCTPWRTQGRPSSTIISLHSRCRLYHGPMLPGACRHGNSNRLPSLILPEREVLDSDCCLSVCVSFSHLREVGRGGRDVGWWVERSLCSCEFVATFSRRPEANDPDKLPHIDLEFSFSLLLLICWRIFWACS